MKTAVVYYSRHHSNTKKLLEAIAAKHQITLIDAVQHPDFDLAPYDLIGFASGIYYSKFHKSVLRFAENNLPVGKDVFFLYTYGAKKDGYTRAIQAAAEKKSAHVVGSFGCFGFNTFGPFKLIGGMAKGHPNQAELAGAVRFYENLLQKNDPDKAAPAQGE